MERAAFAQEESFAVMRRAGAAVAGHVLQMLRGDSRPVLILAGPGNNGGDAFVAAAILRDAGAKVCVAFAGDEKKLPPDAARAFAKWRENGGEIARDIPAADYALAIDGLFGIGLSRAPEGNAAKWIRQIRTVPTLAIDAPSGINGDTGAACGDFVCAARTITFFAAKPGLYTGDGAAAAGDVAVEDLGCADFPPPCGVLLNSAAGLNLQKLRRQKNAHKGACGIAAIVGGAAGMTGALILAARAAVRLGAGKVFALSAASPPLYDFVCPEIMWRCAAELPQFAAAECIAIGPGLGAENVAAVRTATETSAPLVADADALNILAADGELATRFAKRGHPSVITPHPGEAARLLGVSAAEIHSDRIGAAKNLAQKYNAIAVLKGAGTIIANPNGKWAICAAGNPGLAQAGAGDVLTGMLAALVAQTGDAEFAARGAVFLHAAAADEVAKTGGEIGTDLNALPFVAAKILNRETAKIFRQ